MRITIFQCLFQSNKRSLLHNVTSLKQKIPMHAAQGANAKFLPGSTTPYSGDSSAHLLCSPRVCPDLASGKSFGGSTFLLRAIANPAGYSLLPRPQPCYPQIVSLMRTFVNPEHHSTGCRVVFSPQKRVINPTVGFLLWKLWYGKYINYFKEAIDL